MEYKHKLHISKDNTIIFYNDGVKGVSEVRKCLVETEHSSFQMLFDERFNEIDFIYSDNPDDPFKYSNHVGKYLKSKFHQFKSNLILKDFEYRIGNGFEGSKRMILEDFINFLKSENRETIINNILC